MQSRMSERYDVERIRLRPEEGDRARKLVAIVDQLLPGGSVYHVLADTPSQMEDVLAVLVDDRAVVAFELPRQAGASPCEVEFYTVDEYRREVGQGHDRIKFDLAVDAARQLRSNP